MKKKIIIVDDSTFLAEQIGEFMTSIMDYDVISYATDGFQAIEQYRKHQPDLITMDLSMPNKDGKEAIKEIIIEFPTAKIMVISAVKGTTMLECLTLGAKSYVEKPLRFSEELFVDDFKKTIQESIDDE